MRMNLALGIGLTFAVGLTVAADDAGACGNGVWRQTQERVQHVVSAERHAEQGKTRVAAQHVLRHYPAIKKRRLGRSPLSDRALRVMARVVVRSEGMLDMGKSFPGSNDEERAANMSWAVQLLRAYSLRKPKDAVAKTDYGEALARVPKHRPEALHVLEWLEKSDLMASAHGYAALLSLRKNLGEDRPGYARHALRAMQAAPALIAERRCESMTKTTGLCTPAPDQS
jgi:hypothetical protein